MSVRKVLVIGAGGQIERAKKHLAELGCEHITLQPLRPEDLEFEYPEPHTLPFPDLSPGLQVYEKAAPMKIKGSKYHK